MPDLTTATLGPPIFAPLDDVRHAGYRTSLFQGSAFAVDPRTGRGFLFQLQAYRDRQGLRGDEEDLRVHRFRWHSDGTPAALTYVDTMTILKGGHVQQAHVRISAAGTPYLWLGLERYDDKGKQLGADAYRVRYQPKIITRSGSYGVQRVYTGAGTAMPVGAPGWTVCIRRPGSAADLFCWFSERDLLSQPVQKAAKAGATPTPAAYTYVRKSTADDAYQSSLALGKYSDPQGVLRVKGAQVVNLTRVATATPDQAESVDFTGQARKHLGIVNTEPEGAFLIGDVPYVCVQTGTVEKRRLAYFPVSW